MRNPILFLYCLLLIFSAVSNAAKSPALTLENEVLSVTLSPDTAAIRVTDKRSGFGWEQAARPGFHVHGGKAPVVSPTAISATVSGPGQKYEISISLGDKQSPNALDLALSMPGKRYTYLPDYPFPFTNQAAGWHYVQNTSGEGALLPLSNPDAIKKPFGWNGSQPWWGITDLKQAMMARLDSFRLPATGPGENDATVYALPMKIRYSFYIDGGYVGLAKAYRRYFLSQFPQLAPLERKVSRRPGVSYLKDTVYIYFWDDDWHVTAQLIREMKAAGIDRAIAVFYGAKNPNRVSPELFAAIEKAGWLGGLYKMPTGNLFRVSSINKWNLKVLTGEVTEERVIEASSLRAWDRICGPLLAKQWPEKMREETGIFHQGLYYFDTLTVQLAPCLDPEHPATVEQNLEGRKEILRQTQDAGLVVGSGEGLTPTWAIPYLDFFEGAMSLRTYTDIPTKIPGGDYAFDFQNLHTKQTALGLDETMRVPLLALGFHDYAAETWVWRDSNFQNLSLAWKKDLFNILYGAMPNWHVTRDLWDKHQAEYVDNYRKLHAVREKIGFAEMTGHGWLSADKSVQYTDWSTRDRVIVNFGDKAFEGAGGVVVGPRSFKCVERDFRGPYTK